jgi:thiol:disulfide interchange protein DsbD
MRLKAFCTPLLTVSLAVVLSAQGTSPVLTVTPVPTVKVKKGGETSVVLKASLNAGFHCNSNTPTEDYLIPLKLTWTSGPLTSESVVYPKAKLEKYSFSEKPVSVLTGEFAISTKFKASADAATGTTAQSGKLRYQACSDKACYPPKTVDVNLTVTVE